METLIGIILLVTYILFAIYAAKGGNLMLGFFAMAVIWAGLGAIAGVTTWNASADQLAGGMIDINNGIFQQGPELWGSTAAVIIFGSWFGRILVDTGIARSIIRTAVELGGDKPALTTILLSLVTGLIFTSAYGAGSVVAIGVIVFPILLSLGIPKEVATGSFLMSVGAGLYLNSGWLNQINALIPDFNLTDSAWTTFTFIAFAVQMVATFAMIIMFSGKSKKQAWAASSASLEGKNVNILAMITPLLPVILAVFFKVKPITAIIIAVLWALVFTGNLKDFGKVGNLVQKTFFDGVTDVGLVFAFLFFLQMFLRAAKVCAPLLAPILEPIIPNNLLLIFIIFGVLGVLALFRGPLTLWGAGAATLAMLQAIGGIFTPTVLMGLFVAPTTSMNGAICPTQSWCLWAIGYTKTGLKEYFRVTLAASIVATFVIQMLAYFMLAA